MQFIMFLIASLEVIMTKSLNFSGGVDLGKADLSQDDTGAEASGRRMSCYFDKCLKKQIRSLIIR